MKEIKERLIALGCLWMPYLLVSWGYTELTDGTTKTFQDVFFIMIGAKIFLVVTDTLSEVFYWRLYRKKIVVQKILNVLQTNKFPKRFYCSDNEIYTYLTRVLRSEGTSPSVKCEARLLYQWLVISETIGMLESDRMDSAAEAALEAYSPKAEAPPFSLD